MAPTTSARSGRRSSRKARRRSTRSRVTTAGSRTSARTRRPRVPFVFYNYDRSLYDFEDIEGAAIKGCSDGADDPYPEITNCPVFGYSEQGIDLIEQELKTRTSFSAAITQRVRLAGTHVIKAGFDGELTRFTRREPLLRRRSLAPLGRHADRRAGPWQAEQYFQSCQGADPTSRSSRASAVRERSSGVRALARSQRDTQNRNLAAFMQDSWQMHAEPHAECRPALGAADRLRRRAPQGKVSPEGEVIPDTAYALDA